MAFSILLVTEFLLNFIFCELPFFFLFFGNLDKVLLLEIYFCDFQKVAGKSFCFQ